MRSKKSQQGARDKYKIFSIFIRGQPEITYIKISTDP
jgi:hypothetical protein